MARMLPPNIHATVQSGAERDLFVRIRDELPNDWTALHSLGMTIHDRKPWAEIDFVLVGPPGVFCLEVKGGLVERNGGVWYTTPIRGGRQGRPKELKEPPFEQVGSAAAKLFEYLASRVPKLAGAITGYAVATPDCSWTASGPDLDRALVYDDTDALGTFDVFMDRVAGRWNEKVGRGWNRRLELLQKRDKAAVVDAIRGDFSLVPSLRASLESASESLVALTTEQAELFARLSRNQRVIARGGAGTGKTLLAAGEARRLADAGERVLLTCYSRNLAIHLGHVLADCPAVTVRTLHSLMAEIVDGSGRGSEIPDADESDLFDVFYPELALEILLGSSSHQFDAVIVDEGQDLLTEAHLDVLDLSLKGGLRDGTWRWFLDPNQNIFEGIAAPAMARLLGTAAVDWPLTVNCRNTIPIASQVSMLSGVPLTESLATEGPDVEYTWYSDQASQRHELSTRLRKLIHEGFTPDRIAVLSRRRLQKSGANSGLTGSLPPLFDVSQGRFGDAPKGAIRFSTVASFKGLDADAVFLLDVDNLESQDALASVYVGTSRARVLLVVFVQEQARGAFTNQARQFGEAAAQAKQPSN